MKTCTYRSDKMKQETTDQIEKDLEYVLSDCAQNPHDPLKKMFLVVPQYIHSKYVRADNRPEYARYLGYLDARELYPDLKPVSFREFFSEVLEGKGVKPYAGRVWG
jgi:hypothetical protein